MSKRSIETGERIYRESKERAAKKFQREYEIKEARQQLLEAQHPFRPVLINYRSHEILKRARSASLARFDPTEIRLLKQGRETMRKIEEKRLIHMI